jgi:hypothetical protein
MKLWTLDTAAQHMLRVKSGKKVMGLSYWSAYDFLKKHSPATLKMVLM